MNIEKLEIKGFGRISELFLKLNKGFNLVYGENESGKSSTQEFIKAMLFGLKGGRTGKDGELPPLKKYKPWNCQSYGGFIEYKLQSGEVYRVGRNFESNSVTIFDSLYNDITGTFVSGRDKSVKFAEKQLGIDETCFEKTVFVRQMDTVVSSGSRELLNRLSNVYQTGREDISFKRAEDALKKALIKYIGTDRTTTRPLDRITARIRELESLKGKLTEKRKQIFALEERLAELNTRRCSIEAHKLFFGILKQSVQLRNNLMQKESQLFELAKVCESYKEIAQELEDISKNLWTLKTEKDNLSIFAQFGEEDVVEIKNSFSGLGLLKEQRDRMREEILDKNNELEKISGFSSGLSAFKSLPSGIDHNIQLLNKEVSVLEMRYNKDSIDEIDKKLQEVKSKEAGIKHGMLAAFAAAAVILAVGLWGVTPVYWGYIPVVCVLIGFICMLALKKKEYEKLVKNKKTAATEFRALETELVEKRKIIQGIYASVGAENYEDFLKLKLLNGSKAEAIMELNNRISRLENEVHLIDRRISLMNSSILEKLISSKIVENSDQVFQEEHIKAFAAGVDRLKKLQVELRYEEQTYNAKKKMLESILDRVQCKNADSIYSRIKELEDKNSREKLMLQDLAYKSRDILKKGLVKEEYELHVKNIMCEENDISEINTDKAGEIEKSYEMFCAELDDIKLEIKELETFLKGFEADDDTLQGLEEEIFQLKGSKDELEHKGEALKLALEVMQQTSLEIQKDYAPVLNEKMSGIISKITGCRYEDVRVDSSLVLKAVAPETRDIVGITSLSGGAADQMYLAMRIAMAEVLSLSSEKLPLILDEIFSQYDDSRTRDTIRYLKELSEERQVIIFTCKDREVEIAREIFKGNLNLINLAI